MAPEGEEDDVSRRSQNALLNRKRDQDLNEQDLAQIAQDLSKRYGRATVRYTGDMNEVPQRLLMPSVHDASLWQVRVKVSLGSFHSNTRPDPHSSQGGRGTSYSV